MEQIAKILIYVHALFGGIGLLSGLLAIIVKKGKTYHINSGKLFSYAMIISSILSLIISQFPEHENLFLFLIGIFTIYLILSGNRALRLKSSNKENADHIDKTISGIMLLISFCMLALGIIGVIQKIENSILYIFFGGIGVFMTYKDFKTYKHFKTNKHLWIKSHIGRMVGALIASVTAFLVAGLNIGTITIWILPTIIGTIYIIYQNRKFKVSL